MVSKKTYFLFLKIVRSVLIGNFTSEVDRKTFKKTCLGYLEEKVDIVAFSKKGKLINKSSK